MSILIDKNTKVIVQGITGREGSFHTQLMLAYGTNIIGGVTPGKGGEQVLGVPVFDRVKDAVAQTGANASVIFVPPQFAYEAILEAVSDGIELVVCITEGVPVQDMLKAVAFVQERGAKLVGPNSPGIVSVGIGKLGIIPGSILSLGPVGVVSRSGTLTYEIIDSLTRAGIGQSSCVGIGGDAILGLRFSDILPLFEDDPQTSLVVMVGEIGGSDEEDAAKFIAAMTKPVVGFISGKCAPAEKRMGHAGAIISGNCGTVESKEKALKAAGVILADKTREITGLLQGFLRKI